MASEPHKSQVIDIMTALKKSLAETSAGAGEKKKRLPKAAKNTLSRKAS